MRPLPEASAFYADVSRRFFANQESGHGAGYRLRRELSLAGERLSLAVAGRRMSAAWGSSGTELFNMLASWSGLKGGNVLISPMEHPALPAALSRSGAEIRVMPWRNGCPDWEKTESMLDGRTRLAVLFHVQSELGLISDTATFHALVKKRAPGALIMYDTVQSAGKLVLPEADILTVSGHKTGSAGGAALLFNPEKISETDFEAMRRRDYLFGRPEPAAAMTLAFAAGIMNDRREENYRHVSALHSFVRRELMAIRMKNNRSPVPAAGAGGILSGVNVSPYILHFLLPGHQGQVVVRMLSEHGVYVSSGSACQAESGRPSAALSLLGAAPRDGYAGLRISFAPDNTMDEAERFVTLFRQVISQY